MVKNHSDSERKEGNVLFNDALIHLVIRHGDLCSRTLQAVRIPTADL